MKNGFQLWLAVDKQCLLHALGHKSSTEITTEPLHCLEKIKQFLILRLTLNTTNIFVYPTFMMTFLIDDDQDYNKSWAGGSFGIKSYS